MTDSLDMDAVLHFVSRRDAVIKAISAGNDLLMIKNVGLFDPYLPQNAMVWIREAIEAGILHESDIVASADRVRKLKQEIAGLNAGVSAGGAVIGPRDVGRAVNG
jgi:beta-N-acetylhexosaminidase